MIKIKNIYHMLAYAFQVLKEDCYAEVAEEKFEHVENLLAAILAKGIANQVKRGLGREYVFHRDALSSPRGKISISASIKERTTHKKQLVCEFDEFSENAYINRILKTTAMILIRSGNVASEQKNALKRVMRYFHAVDTLHPRDIRWTGIRYHSNNATYKMLLHICRLVMEALLPATQAGSGKMLHFKDETMHRLFERFVREYYRKEHPGFQVSAAHIDWNVDDDVKDSLPTMHSDITVEYEGKTLIIDTKWYGRTMQTHYDRRTIHSGNLYQIYAYVKNKDTRRSGNISGLLLYAKTDEAMTPDSSWRMDGNRIHVRTLDLNQDFREIKKQLEAIIGEWLSYQNNRITEPQS